MTCAPRGQLRGRPWHTVVFEMKKSAVVDVMKYDRSIVMSGRKNIFNGWFSRFTP
jgi:hypothetical protein